MHRKYSCTVWSPKTINPLAAIILLAMALLVTACSFKSVYNRLDFLIAEYVEGFVTLDDVLESDLENKTELLLDWHRTTQLKQYAEWFREIQADTNPDLDEERLKYHEHKLETYWNNISSRLNSDMAEFLPRLSQQQIVDLFASLEDENEEFREDYIDIDDSERREKYIENISDIYEDWFDELSDEQILFVEEAASNIKSGAALRLELRLQWQSKIHEILISDHTQQKKERLLNQFFDSFDMNNEPGLKSTNDTNKAVFRELTMKIVHSMSSDQHAYFKQRTDDYIRMFEELAEYR
jgi:hypothetical protein